MKKRTVPPDPGWPRASRFFHFSFFLLHSPPARRRQGVAFTLIEVVLSTVVVSVMLVAALQAVASARTGMRWVGGRSSGMLLAQDLMAEILQQAYCDPGAGADTLIGPGADEVVTANRSLYDDVDDYNGWQASPPQYKDGTVLTWATGYERRVSVVWATPADLRLSSGSSTGIKCITVTVRRDGLDVAQLVALRTSAWIAPSAILGGSGP